MKKLGMTVAVLACAASVVSAQTVTSANIVGFGKVPATNGLQIASMQFLNGETNTLDSVFGDLYPEGTKILTYDGGYTFSTYAISYPPPTYQPVLGWSDGISTLAPGQGFWIQLPPASTGEYEALMNGEVPMDDSVTNAVASGLNLFSYPYPVDVEIQNLGFVPSLGDKIFVYSNTGGYTTISYAVSYPPPAYDRVEGWSNPSLTIPVGGGFWYQTSAPASWIVNRPFAP